MTTVISVACCAFRIYLESHVGCQKWRAAPGGDNRDSARRRAARGRQRKAPGCKRGTAQGAGLREGNSARRQTTRVGEQRKTANCESGTAQGAKL
eukprot:3104799-Pleurochrysis_carterae.AAC.3